MWLLGCGWRPTLATRFVGYSDNDGDDDGNGFFGWQSKQTSLDCSTPTAWCLVCISYIGKHNIKPTPTPHARLTPLPRPPLAPQNLATPWSLLSVKC